VRLDVQDELVDKAFSIRIADLLLELPCGDFECQIRRFLSKRRLGATQLLCDRGLCIPSNTVCRRACVRENPFGFLFGSPARLFPNSLDFGAEIDKAALELGIAPFGLAEEFGRLTELRLDSVAPVREEFRDGFSSDVDEDAKQECQVETLVDRLLQDFTAALMTVSGGFSHTRK